MKLIFALLLLSGCGNFSSQSVCSQLHQDIKGVQSSRLFSTDGQSAIFYEFVGNGYSECSMMVVDND